MATKIPIQGIIQINGREIKNTYNELKKEMRKVENRLKGMTQGTTEYEEKSAELKEVSTHWQKINKELKEQKGYLKQTTEELIPLKNSYNGVLREMQKVEEELKGMEEGTSQYEKKSAELKKVATHWNKINEEIKEQKKYLKEAEQEVTHLEGSYNALEKEMHKIENELKGITKETAAYEKKSAELKEVATRWQEVNQDIKAQKGYLKETTEETDSFGDSLGNLKEGFSALKRGDFKGFSDSVIGGFQGMKAGARSFFTTLMANPVTAVVAIIAGLVVGVGALVKKWWGYNKEIAKSVQLTHEITKTTGELADTIRNRATAMSKTFGTEFQENLKKADKLVKTFGVSYDEAFDMMEKAIAKGADKNGEFFESIDEYDVHFKDAGYSAQEFIDILNAGADLNIYKDKLPDAIKEATEALTDPSKALKESLTSSFGAAFSNDLLKRIETGKTKVKDGLNEISKKAEEVSLNHTQITKLTSSLFKSAGLDGGKTVKIFEAINKAVKDTNRPLTEMEQRTLAIAKSNKKLQESKDALFKSDKLIKFQHDFSMAWNNIKIAFFDTITGIKNVWESFDASLARGIQYIGDRVVALKRAFSSGGGSYSDELEKILKNREHENYIKKRNKFIQGAKDIQAKNLAKANAKDKVTEAKVNADKIAAAKRAAIAIKKAKENTKSIKINDGSGDLQNAKNSLIKGKQDYWDLSHSLDKKGMKKEIELAKERTKRELKNITADNEKRKAKIIEINAEIARLNELKKNRHLSKSQKTEITKAVGNRQQEKGTYENLTKIDNNKKQFVIKQGLEKISQIKEEYIFRDLDKLKTGHAQEQKLLHQKYELDGLTHDYSEQQKLAKKKEYQDKKLVLDKEYLISSTAKVKELLNAGNWEGRDLSKVVLSDEGKEKLKENLLEAGFEIEKINALLAQMKGGGGAKGIDLGLGDGMSDIFGMNPDQWEGLITNLQNGKVGVQEVVAGVMVLQSVWQTYQKFQQQGDEEETRRYNGMMDSKKKALKKQLDEGYISQKKYDKEVEKIDKAKNKRQADLEYKKAKQEKRSALVSAVINTAVAVAKVVGNPFLWPVVAAAGAAQIALIASKKVPKPSYAKGGYTKGIGEFDKDGELAGNAHAGEWYAPKWMVKNPETAPVIDWLESKRNGQNKPSPLSGSGNSITKESTEETETKTNDSEFSQLMYGLVLRGTELLERLEENGLEAYILSNEKTGKELRSSIKRYENLKADNKQ